MPTPPFSSSPSPVAPPPPAFPLVETLAAWGRHRLGIALVALAAALAGGVLSALSSPRYASHVTLIIDVEAQMEVFAARMAAVFDAAVPVSLRAEIDRGAEAFVHLTGDRIIAKDQTVEQYLTAWKAHTLAALLARDAVTDRLAEALGPRLEAAWPEAARDPGRLRQWALRVHRDRPQSVVRLSFVAPDADLARDGLALVVETLLDLEAAQRQALRDDLLEKARRRQQSAADLLADGPAAPPGGDASARRAAAQAVHAEATESLIRLESAPDLIACPLIVVLSEPSPPLSVGPRPGLAAARWLVAATLAALLATAVFSGVRAPVMAPCRPLAPDRRP